MIFVGHLVIGGTDNRVASQMQSKLGFANITNAKNNNMILC